VSAAILAVAAKDFAQERTVAAARSGATIPLSTYSISPTKVREKKPLTGTILGTSPFPTPLTGSTIDAVLVPIIFDIGGAMFDPAAPNDCDSGISAVNALKLFGYFDSCRRLCYSNDQS
jgi:hypothetical protein